MVTSQANTLQQIEQWHKDARPVVTDDNLRMALAVHIEEFLEMLEAIDLKISDRFDINNPAYEGVPPPPPNAELGYIEHLLNDLVLRLKLDECAVVLSERQRNAFLDGLADQIVTAVGCGVAAGMNVPEAVNRVQISNDSKRCPDTGKFFFDEQGKITKPNWYQRPDLSGLY